MEMSFIPLYAQIFSHRALICLIAYSVGIWTDSFRGSTATVQILLQRCRILKYSSYSDYLGYGTEEVSNKKGIVAISTGYLYNAYY